MHTVLVVDDDPRVCDLVVLTLREEARCRTLAAARGQTAIELATAQCPDALLLDVRLPDMDGFAVCRMLKAQPSTADMSIIFLTALHDTASELVGLACGAVDYVRKPFAPEVLVARVQRALVEHDRRAAVLNEYAALRARLPAGAARIIGGFPLFHRPAIRCIIERKRCGVRPTGGRSLPPPCPHGIPGVPFVLHAWSMRTRDPGTRPVCMKGGFRGRAFAPSSCSCFCASLHPHGQPHPALVSAVRRAGRGPARFVRGSHPRSATPTRGPRTQQARAVRRRHSHRSRRD